MPIAATNLKINFMKNILFAIVAITTLNLGAFAQQKSAKSHINVSMDLNIVVDDKIMVSVTPSKISENKIVFKFPKIVPGTYSEDDYGTFIDDFKAIDQKGKALPVTKLDVNSFEIANAKSLQKITYWVNDTYDIENTHEIFSPAGTNILANKNFLLNMHGFVGYFDNTHNTSYTITIDHPKNLWGATSLIDTDESATRDVYNVKRYPDLVDSPIMYSEPNYSSFKIGDVDVLISVYSPNNLVTAESLRPSMEKMMVAQKNFLGDIKTTNKYSILLYLSNMRTADAQGFGALEHNTSTTVVFPEMMPNEQLVSAMVDVVSHEFFHIVTPLSVHSEEIHNFNYNEPKMSQHLWMYEGVTEYFANLFQVQQDLIDEAEFYTRISEKISNASKLDDTMSFTEMSKNVLEEPYKSQYLNVYEKGTLIGMCIDIIIREKSDGKRGILDLMQKLSVIYGANKPFNDSELFAKITELTYPEVGAFLDKHVKGKTPINYYDYFAKMGVGEATNQVAANVFLKDQTPYISIVPSTKEITVIPGIELSQFLSSLGLKGGDIITEVNQQPYNLDNIYELIMGSQEWKAGDPVTMTIKRNDKVMHLKGKVMLTYVDRKGLMGIDANKEKLRNTWLKQ